MADAPLMSHITAWVVFIIVVLVTAYDMIINWKLGEKATISNFMLTVAREYPVLPLALGVLLGHLFWPQHRPVASPPVTIQSLSDRPPAAGNAPARDADNLCLSDPDAQP